MPINLIKGLLINTEEEPVIANTKKIEISSHLYFTCHFFSNLEKIKSVIFKSTKKIIALKIKVNAILYSFKNKEDNLKDE